MEQYIKKSALVAEIERRKLKNEEWKNSSKGIDAIITASMVIQEDINILSFLDTLEVKEVDIDKLCEFRKNIGFAYPESASEYQKQLACYRQGIKDVIKAQKGE